MGAYDNPRFINAPNYMAGTQAFLTTFKQGFEQEFQKGQDLIADRKEYEDGIYQKGEELKNELDAALGNSAQSKAQIQSALKSFYDEALSVDMPTKKGLGGLFTKPTERRLGKLDLIEAQNSFTDSVAGVNTAFNYVYDPEIDIHENEDRGHELYAEKRAIYNAIKAGKHNLKFDYASGKFTSSINVINPNTGKMEAYTPDRIQTIFTASGKEQRDLIDASKNEFDTSLKNRTNTEIEQAIAEGKFNNESVLTDFDSYGQAITREMLGTANLDKTAMPDNDSMNFINNMYNNHANNVSTTKQLELMRAQGITKEQISDTKLMEILQEPMLQGEGHYKKMFPNLNSEDLNKSIIFGKARIVEESFMNDLRGSGIFNKAFRKVVPQRPGLTDGQQERLDVLNYAGTRAEEIARIGVGTQVTNTTDDVTGSMVAQGGSGTESFGFQPIAPGTVTEQGVRYYDNPAFDNNEDESEENPKTIPGLAATDEVKATFIGKVLKLDNKGGLRRVKDVFIKPNGDLDFDYEDTTITQTQGGEKQQVDVIDSTTPFNIYEPTSMKSMYKLMMSDLKSEDSNVTADNAYNQLISNAYLSEPERFADRKYDKWANYINRNYGVTNMLKNPEFVEWLYTEENGANLPTKHPFRKLYDALVAQQFNNL